MAKKDKKRQEELKRKLYKMIDDIEDERVLHKLNEEIVPYITKKQKSGMKETDDELTPEQIKELKESIEEAERGETITWEEYKKLTARWRTD